MEKRREVNWMMVQAGRVMMNEVEKGICYGWDTATAYDEIKHMYESLKISIVNEVGDITTLSNEELAYLGFSKWDDDSGLYLIPLWAFDLIPDGTKLTAIDGETRKKRGTRGIDMDVRFGCLAWGLVRDE